MRLLRLNIRHALPRTEQRINHGRFDQASAVPAQAHTTFRPGQSNLTASQPVTFIDNYQSRRAWGARNLTDLTREFGQRGISDVQAGTSKRAQIAWERAENGGKPGNDIKEQIMQEVHADPPETMVGLELMEGPEISVTPSQIVGETDVGEYKTVIEPPEVAKVHYTPGSVETYVADQGFIRRWVTENEYDIYA